MSHGFLSMTRRQSAKVPNGTPSAHLVPKRPGWASRKWNACWLSFLTLKKWFIKNLYLLVRLWLDCRILRNSAWKTENESPTSVQQSPIRGSFTMTMCRAGLPSPGRKTLHNMASVTKSIRALRKWRANCANCADWHLPKRQLPNVGMTDEVSHFSVRELHFDANGTFGFWWRRY